jgi:Predicted permeases
MMTWLPFALAGAVAQLVDGSLGMGFGLTSSTLLLTLGASAAVASAAVHFAEIGTTLASGVSHWHRENVDKKYLSALQYLVELEQR